MAPSDPASLPDEALVELPDLVGATVWGDHDGRGLRIGVACALFNGAVTWRLLKGMMQGCARCGVDPRDVTAAWAPGAFELPLVAQRFAATGAVDAIVCLGAVIRGETGHYDVVAEGCASGLQRVQLDTDVPVVLGVLTTDTLDQALARSQPDESNKGFEAAVTAVSMTRLLRSSRLQPPAPGRATRTVSSART